MVFEGPSAVSNRSWNEPVMRVSISRKWHRAQEHEELPLEVTRTGWTFSDIMVLDSQSPTERSVKQEDNIVEVQ
jgi:hypothetical protein